jgi:3-hydroxybutyrate dehydrogenase
MVARAQTELGSLDILVNNAGIQFVAPIAEFPADRWDAIIAINLSSAFHAMHAAIPGMKARGWGRIVNIASAHGLVGSAEKSAYVAAKHGILGLTKVAAIELANDGITCNAICPGWVLTPLVQKQLDDRAAREGRAVAELTTEFLTEKQPMAAFSTPEQIGALTVFLCSEAARTMTGTPVSIDGGWTAR